MTISTKTRIACARTASRAIVALRGQRRGTQVTVRRRGIVWALDLTEGIDLSIYLLGSFEPSVVRTYLRLVRPGDIVLDIGANVGAHTLPLARAVGPTGRVVAFEPTAWASAKLRANLDLNPDLAGRVRAEQVMLAGAGDSGLPSGIYSSWPLTPQGDLHPQHLGRLMSTDDARVTSLDDYVSGNGVEKVDFVKLDVDGAEPDVLWGATATVARHRPVIVMELAPYIYDGTDRFEHLVDFLATHDYCIERLRGGRLPADATVLRGLIPAGSSLNVLCRPQPPAPGR